jgi:pyruvate/2-oxoglutarate/acetoin dehydrogenase E1 component
VKRAGQDITLLANMLMVHAPWRRRKPGHGDQRRSDRRSLPAPLDLQTLVQSAIKTTRVLIVEEDNYTGGWGAEVAARLSEAAFFYLDAPVTRVAAPDVPAPYAPNLERVYVPDVEKIVQVARALIQ